MDDTRPPAPLELRQLQTATRRYLAAIEEARTWAEIEADVNRVVRPDYAAELGRLRDELRAARSAREMGTPAGIAQTVNELLGEA